MNAPHSNHAPSAMPGDLPVSETLAKTFGLDAGEWQRVVKTLGRTPSYAELGVVSVMWSEHCSYKSTRIHLRRLPTTGPKVVVGPGENAGAVDIGDGFCAVFKMESHNHPSFIEPYQGAATGVGGILRDVFTMGARPVALLNSLRFGRPDHPKTPRLVKGVVAGIGGYGNCIGVPTVGGEIQFDTSYDGNILVNAFAVGIAKSEKLFFGTASGLGNAVLYVGAKTGRDGIHGATMASAEFDDASEKKLPTVQVGDPFVEKLLLEACLEIFRAGCLEGVQDMGAAGLTSSSVEMAARAGNGIELDLDAIPRRTERLTPYEMLLSESQERMLMVAKPGREHEVFEVCAKWDLDVAIIGRVTDTGRFVCKATPGYDPLAKTERVGEAVVAVDLPIEMLTDEAPKYDRPRMPAARRVGMPSIENVGDLGEELLSLLASPNIGSRAKVWRQYDHIVRDGTVFRPGESDAAVIRVFCDDDGQTIEKFLALSVDCNGRHVALDAHAGAAMAVAECARNIVCSGAEPLGLTDCLNFGAPTNPATMADIASSIDGIADACSALGVPVVSGNVSLYNATGDTPILPTPTVAIVGQLAHADDRLGLSFVREGELIAHLGTPSRGHVYGSEWATQKLGKTGIGPSPGIDLDAERRLQALVLELARARVLSSAHDVSDGGLAVCLAESTLRHGVGAHVRLPDSASNAANRLFAEEPSRVVVSFAPEHGPAVETLAKKHGVPVAVIGTTGGTSLRIADLIDVSVARLTSSHSSALDAIV